MLIAKERHQSDHAFEVTPEQLTGALIAGIALALLSQIWVIFGHRFNEDEFHYLSQVHGYLRGDLELPLQTLHVHLFAPFASLLPSEVEQLIAGRLTMLIFEGVSLASLYLLARTWSGQLASLLVVLAFATMPLTLMHGASFRTDPIALAPIMAALALLARAPIRAFPVAAVGLLTAIAFLVTVKVIFFAPAFAGIAVWRIATSEDRRGTAVRIAAMAAVAAVASLAIYLLHQSTLQVATVEKSRTMLSSAGSVTLFNAGFLPAKMGLLVAAATAPLQTLLILASAATLSFRLFARGSRHRWQMLALLGCIAPMVGLLFYRNAFTYFIPTISAPAFAAGAWFIEQRRWPTSLLGIFSFSMLAAGMLLLLPFTSHDQSAQRSTIRMVHRIFPEPVPHLDASGMVASFPRHGFYMSGWGMAEYRKRPPIFENMLREKQIPLLLVNGSALEHGVGVGESKNGKLHPEDQSVLRENYLPHWGPVWVAGKRIPLPAGEGQTIILIPGLYTIEGSSVRLDGREYSPGDTVVLERGPHRLSGAAGTEVTLRWGNRLARPDVPVPKSVTRL